MSSDPEQPQSEGRCPLSDAERQQRHRKRLALGLFAQRGDVPFDLIDALIDEGLLNEITATDPEAVGAAVVEAARRWINATTGRGI